MVTLSHYTPLTSKSNSSRHRFHFVHFKSIVASSTALLRHFFYIWQRVQGTSKVGFPPTRIWRHFSSIISGEQSDNRIRITNFYKHNSLLGSATIDCNNCIYLFSTGHRRQKTAGLTKQCTMKLYKMRINLSSESSP